jgi:hypothetical protein
MVPAGALKAFLKLGSQGNDLYRRAGEVLLDKEIPILPRLPKDHEKARSLLETTIRGTTSEHWTHPQVAVRNLPLKAMGFKPTRLAIPLAGEKWFTPSYRSGRLHAHKMGPFYLVHEDGDAPDSVAQAVGHLIKDVPKPLARRLFEKLTPPVKSR